MLPDIHYDYASVLTGIIVNGSLTRGCAPSPERAADEDSEHSSAQTGK